MPALIVGLRSSTARRRSVCGSGESLSHQHVNVSARMVAKLADHLKAKLPIEAWRLETMSREHELPAAASHGLRLGLSHQATAKSRAAKRRCDPHLTELACPSPCIASGPRHDVLVIVPQEDAERPAVGDTSRAGIELVQPILQKLDVRRR